MSHRILCPKGKHLKKRRQGWKKEEERIKEFLLWGKRERGDVLSSSNLPAFCTWTFFCWEICHKEIEKSSSFQLCLVYRKQCKKSLKMPLISEQGNALQRHNTKNSKQIFPEKELRRLRPNFHIHVPVSNLYIPTIGLPILSRKICGPILGIYKSLTDTWLWKLGLRPRNTFSGNT